MSNLFISHSSRDNAAAKELQARLEEQGHRSVFLDLDPETGIQAGVSWERTLYTKLRACRAVVALCSDSYLASQWCFAEIALARMEGKELFVLQIDPWGEQTQMPSILTEEQFIDLRTDKDEGYQRLWNGFQVKGIVPAEAREWKTGEPPYPGLRAFREEDAPIFFGRDEEIREGGELLNRVRRQGHPRLVMVLGSSGSGKSSLVRAGIVPHLRSDGARWLVVPPFRPGRQPARALAASLSRAFDPAGQAFPWEKILGWLEPEAAGDLAEPAAPSPATAEGAEPNPAVVRQRLLQALRAMEGELTAADANLASSVRRLKEYLDQKQAETLLSGSAPPPSAASPLAELASRLRLAGEHAEASVVLVVDQFEELLGHDAQHPASRFLAMLRAAIEAEDSPLLVIGTMRSDYLGALQRSVPLRGLGFKSLSVGPMSRDGMRQLIEEPARLGQIQLENGLADLLLEDTETADALPLLAFTLRMMWDRDHDKRRLETRDYKDFGRLQGAVAQVADETFNDVLEQVPDKDARDALARELRDAFLSMARPAAEGSGWSRQPVSWEQLSETVRPALEPFIDPQRLLVKREDGTVEVAHEALFRSWDRLRGWLDENAEGLHLLREIHVEAKKWDAAGTEEDQEPYLFRGGRLARAVELREAGVLPLQDLDRLFVEASDGAEKARIEAEKRRQRQKLRRARIFAAVVGALLLLAVGLGYRAHRQSQIALSRELAIAAQNNLEKDPELSVLLALHAVETAPTSQAEAVLHRAAAASRRRLFLVGHEGDVQAVAFSPNCACVATAGGDNTVKIWDAGSGRELKTLSGHTSGVTQVVFGADGSRLASASTDGTVRIWATASGEELRKLEPGGELLSVAFSPDDAYLAAGSNDATAKVWDLSAAPTAEPLILSGHQDRVVRVAFNSDGSQLVTVSDDHTARIWDATSGHEVRSMTDSSDLLGVAFSPDDSLLATAGLDRTAKLWGVDDGEVKLTLVGHSGPVKGVAFSPDGTRLVTASLDGSARVWDAVFGALLFTVPAPAGLRAADVSRDGRRLAAVGDQGTAFVADFLGEELLTLDGHDSFAVSGVAFNSRHNLVASAGLDYTAKLWDGRSGRQLLSLDHEEEVTSIAFSPHADLLATGDAGGTVTVWPFVVADGPASGTVTGGDSRTLHAGGEVLSVALSPAAPLLASGGTEEAEVKIWDLRSDTVVRDLSDHSDPVLQVVFSPDGSRLATASEDGTAKVWSATTGKVLWTSEKHAGAVVAVAFGPAGKLLATASDNRVSLWDLASHSLRRELRDEESLIRGLAFSPDGVRLATAGQDGKLRVWEVRSGDLLFVLGGHSAPLQAVRVDPDGSRFAIASEDGTVRLFAADIPTLQAVAYTRVGRALTPQECSRYLHTSACPPLRGTPLPASGARDEAATELPARSTAHCQEDTDD